VPRADQAAVGVDAALGEIRTQVPTSPADGEVRDVSVDEAFTLMRDHSRRQHLRLTDLALAVVTDPASHPDLTGTHRR
jgi:hypothetical protein